MAVPNDRDQNEHQCYLKEIERGKKKKGNAYCWTPWASISLIHKYLLHIHFAYNLPPRKVSIWIRFLRIVVHLNSFHLVQYKLSIGKTCKGKIPCINSSFQWFIHIIMLTRFQKKCIQYILVHASFSLNFRLNQQSSLWPAQQTELNTQPFPGTTNHFNHPWCRCQGSIKYIDDPSTWRSSHRTTTTSTSDGTLPNLCWRWDVDFWLWFREFDKIFKLRKNKSWQLGNDDLSRIWAGSDFVILSVGYSCTQPADHLERHDEVWNGTLTGRHRGLSKSWNVRTPQNSGKEWFHLVKPN